MLKERSSKNGWIKQNLVIKVYQPIQTPFLESPCRFKKRILPEVVHNTSIINTNIDKDKNNEKIFKNIKILYTNVDQLNEGKKTELKEIIRQYKPLIIAICEIKPKKNNK